MTATAHALVGAAIASRIADPLTAGALSVISHFILDAVPHWDFGTNWNTRPKWLTGMLAISETVIGVTVAYFLFAPQAASSALIVSIIASELPDWIEAPWFIFYVKSRDEHQKPTKGDPLAFFFSLTHKYFNLFHTKAQLPFGLITQIITVIFFFLLLG